MSLKCAIQLGIPDIIHSHGRAMTLSELVNALPINKAKGQDYVYRLMRILTHAGFFIQAKVNNENEECYLLSSSSYLLLKDEPMNMIPFLQAQLDPILMDPFHSLSQWFKNGDSTPFATFNGKPLFECAEKERRLNRLFNEAMSSDARLIISIMIEHCKGVFEGLKSIVDVGGGTGTVAKAIADKFPKINCIVFDLPHVIEGYEGSENLSYVRGDMFKSIPSADAILLKKCKEAIPSKENGGKFIIDMVLDNQKGDQKTYETQLFWDMLMMGHTSGKERTQQDWAKLFSNAGFSDYKIIPNLGLRSIIEVYP
ncbi:trans-resveratrol di-o-methyltransferase [Nicotiana attenuata]|uniref:Myricetin 7/4'-O-methyltransferase 2 n=1 Tax=Nicotiana attenuata TaxID=49451 RepID=A0A314LDV7_NICAT|nr:trans-resveratrol di-o-methyltransferase [Nicotiana attenuata]